MRNPHVETYSDCQASYELNQSLSHRIALKNKQDKAKQNPKPTQNILLIAALFLEDYLLHHHTEDAMSCLRAPQQATLETTVSVRGPQHSILSWLQNEPSLHKVGSSYRNAAVFPSWWQEEICFREALIVQHLGKLAPLRLVPQSPGRGWER